MSLVGQWNALGRWWVAHVEYMSTGSPRALREGLAAIADGGAEYRETLRATPRRMAAATRIAYDVVAGDPFDDGEIDDAGHIRNPDGIATGQPPFQVPAEQFFFTYSVPADRVRPHLPKDFALHEVAGRTAVLVAASHFSHPDLDEVPGLPYSEVATIVPVVHEGETGVFYLGLHLNDGIPVRTGIELYGFPKEKARVPFNRADHYADRVEISAESPDGEQLFAFRGEEQVGLVGAVNAWTSAFAMLDAMPTVSRSYFVRDGDLVTARVESRNVGSVRRYHVDSIDLPELDRLGILNPTEADRPLSATYVKGDLFIGKPRVIGVAQNPA